MSHPLERVFEILGSQVALATALGVTKAAVGQWRGPGRKVPAEHCPVIERLTSGAVRCEDLRPDVQWAVLRAKVPARQGRRQPARGGASPRAPRRSRPEFTAHPATPWLMSGT